MTRYLIEQASFGSTEGYNDEIIFGFPVASVKFSDGSQSQWLSIMDADGFILFSLADHNVQEPLERETPSAEFEHDFDKHMTEEFNGIGLYQGYESLCQGIGNDPQNPAVPLLRYLIALVRSEPRDARSLIRLAEGKYADELDMPFSDVEKEYLAY